MTQAEPASGYIYDQAWANERDRLEAIADVYDEGTRRHIGALGLQPGWRCLEVGAGAGSIARWLAAEVGSGGHVVATDIDPRYVDAGGHANLEVRKHDVTRDPLESDAYDLVHARMLVEHLPARDAVAARLAAGLRPGGWLLLEDVDFAGPMGEAIARYSAPEAQATVLQVTRAFDRAMTAAGADVGFGAELVTLLRGAGLTELGGELRAPLLVTRPDRPHWIRLSLQEIRPILVSSGLLDDATVEAWLSALGEPGTAVLTAPVMAAWGRRPAA